MNTKTNADDVDGAQVLSDEELMEARGGQEEVAVVPFLVGYGVGKALDRAYDSFSAWARPPAGAQQQ